MSLGSYAWGTKALAGPDQIVAALSSTAEASLGATADVTVQKPLAGTAEASVGITAKVDVGAPLASTAQASLGATAAVTAEKPLASTAGVALEASADVDLEKPLASTAQASLDATARVNARKRLASTASVSLETSADLTNSKPLASTAAVELHISARLAASLTLRSTAEVAFGAAAVLTVEKPLASTATAALEAAPDLENEKPLASTARATLDAVALLRYIPSYFTTAGAVNGAAVNETATNGAGLEFLSLQAAIRQYIYEPDTLSADIRQLVYEQLPDFGAAVRWDARVTLGGDEISDRLTGDLTVTAEEGLARTAEFTYLPPAGAVDVSGWINLPVTIDYLLLNSDGAVLWSERLFSGVVDNPEYSIQGGRVRFTCTDQLQRVVDGLSREQIDALTPDALTAERLNGDSDRFGWDYLQGRLDTLPGDVDMDAFRRLRYTPWPAAATPAIEYGSGAIVDESPDLSLLTGSEVVNAAELEFEYRYTRLKEREYKVAWAFPGTTCDYLLDTRDLPNREMILSALEGTGWIVKNISFEKPPGTGTYDCSAEGGAPDINRLVTESFMAQMVWSFQATLAKRYTQPVTERYDVRLRAPQSQAGIGTQPVTRRERFEVPYDATEWTESDSTDDIQTGVLRVGSEAELIRDKTDVEGYDRDAANAVIDVMMASGRREILAEHRRNTVAFEVICQADIDLDQTVRMDDDYISAQGKVRGFTHRLTFGAGSARATTTVQLAISRRYSDSQALDSDLVRPEVPSVELYPAAGSVLDTQSNSQYGGHNDSGEYDEDQEGFAGNYEIRDEGAPVFPVRFLVTTPDIPASETEDLEAPASTELQIAIPQDELEVISP